MRINFDKLEEEYKRVMNTTKNVDRINKQKLIDYERKMAALNAEINLTQNLYNSFLTAKSKVVKKGEGMWEWLTNKEEFFILIYEE